MHFVRVILDATRMYGFREMKVPRNIIGCRVLIFPFFFVHSSKVLARHELISSNCFRQKKGS